MNNTTQPKKYELVVGLEIHNRLRTNTKMFCRCSNKIYHTNGDQIAPNENICPVCLGMPGALPVLNDNAYRKGILAGLALHCTIPKIAKFDRKSYFYPDSPKGFQISQFDEPIAINGYVTVIVAGTVKKIGITRLHLEDDAGKLMHQDHHSFCDFNRSGAPLAETVTEPDFRSSLEVTSFLKEFQGIMRYLKVSRADMDKGEMRCDVNISIRAWGAPEFGTKVELKNMNSITAVGKAIAYEYTRQCTALTQGTKIVQETRGWDDARGTTSTQRIKEDAADYRYFPEPDLPILKISPTELKTISQDLVELPTPTRLRLEKLGVRPADAEILTSSRDLLHYFETAATGTDIQQTSNFILSTLLALLKEQNSDITKIQPTPIEMHTLVKMSIAKTISASNIKKIIIELFTKGGDLETIITNGNYTQISDDQLIDKLVAEVLTANPEIIAQIKGGKERAIGALVGQVMKKSQGQANPAIVNDLITAKLK